MRGIITIIKMNTKLLLRNKGYLFFLTIIPVLAVIMLNLKSMDGMYSENATNGVQELETEEQRILNMSNEKMSIKVYDCSDSVIADYILDELAKTEAYNVFRYKSEPISSQEAKEKALYSANHNTLGAIIYIPEDFEENLLSGNLSNMIIFEGNNDERIALMESNIDTYTGSIYRYAKLAEYKVDTLYELLETSAQTEMTREVQQVNVEDTVELNLTQKNQSSSISYSISFLTIAFLFSGIFIAASIIDERKNRVYTRFILASDSMLKYGLAKLLMIVVNVIMQTGIIALGIKLLVKTDFGISFMNYILIVFCLGLIFTSLSVVIGVLANNVLTSNYIAFLVWTISCLLAGLYFPLDGASKWWERASLLMPQRWGVKTAEMFMIGDPKAYTTFLMVVAGFLIVIMSIGLLGINIKKKED